MNQNKISDKEKKIFGIIAIVLFLVFCGVVTWFIGKPLIKFVSEPEKFRNWVLSHGIFSRFAFIGMVMFQVIIALVPGEPFEIGAGYAFGAIEGTILVCIGITLGSLVVYFLVKTFGVRLLEIFFSKEKINSLKFLKNEKKLGLYTFIIFFLPGTPKDLLTYFVGLTKLKFSHFILIASLARLPSVITSTIGGSALGLKNYTTAIVVFAVTGLISAFGIIVYRFICKKKSNDSDKKN